MMPFPSPLLFGSAAGGASPAFVIAGTFTTNAGSATAPTNVPYPTGLLVNDIAFLEVISRENSITPHTVDTPPGWTLVGESGINGLTRNRHALFYKRLTGSESGTVGINRTPAYSATDEFGGIISIWRGCIASGTPYEGLNTNTTTATTMTGSSVTTAGPNRLVVDFLGRLEGTQTTTAPAGRTKDYDQNNASLMAVIAAEKAAASAGTVGADTYTLSAPPLTRDYHVFSLGLIPT
jgi:hypothetical protein